MHMNYGHKSKANNPQNNNPQNSLFIRKQKFNPQNLVTCMISSMEKYFKPGQYIYHTVQSSDGANCTHLSNFLLQNLRYTENSK